MYSEDAKSYTDNRTTKASFKAWISRPQSQQVSNVIGGKIPRGAGSIRISGTHHKIQIPGLHPWQDPLCESGRSLQNLFWTSPENSSTFAPLKEDQTGALESMVEGRQGFNHIKQRLRKHA